MVDLLESNNLAQNPASKKTALFLTLKRAGVVELLESIFLQQVQQAAVLCCAVPTFDSCHVHVQVLEISRRAASWEP